MKNLFLFALAAMLFAGCSKDESEQPFGSRNPVKVMQEEPLSIHVYLAESETLENILTGYRGLNIDKIHSLKITGKGLDYNDFCFINEMSNLKNVDISGVNMTQIWRWYSSFVENLILPNTLEKIGKCLFWQSKLKSVVIPKNVWKIDEKAFAECESLTSIEIPASVCEIGENAFYKCSSLKTVTFEKGSKLEHIGGEWAGSEYVPDGYYPVFKNCTALTSIEIPANVKVIGGGVFDYCSSLKTVTFEKGSKLKAIGGGEDHGYGAFSDCTALTSIEIPASVETIGVAAFKGCSKLATVTFEKGSKLKTICGRWSCPYAFYSYGAFSDCTALTSIQIPASVETIGKTAFSGCSKLATVTFEKGSKLKTIEGEYYVEEDYQSFEYHPMGPFSDCTALTSIEIPASVETIGIAAFQGCRRLETVTFEKGSKLKVIYGGSNVSRYSHFYSSGAFYELNLTTFDASACTQLKTIGDFAFARGFNNVLLFKIGTKTPPRCNEMTFNGICKSYSVLKVPSGCADAYRTASLDLYHMGWSNFAEITELDE